MAISHSNKLAVTIGHVSPVDNFNNKARLKGIEKSDNYYNHRKYPVSADTYWYTV